MGTILFALVGFWGPLPFGSLITPPVVQEQTSSMRNISEPHPWAMRHADMRRTSQSPGVGADEGIVRWQWLTNGRVPSLAVSRDDLVYLGVTFQEPVWSNEMYLTVLMDDGDVAWRHRVEPYRWGASQGVDSGPSLDLADNVVLNSSNGNLLKYDDDGTLHWTIQREDNATNDSAPAVDQRGFIYQYNFGPVIFAFRYTKGIGFAMHQHLSRYSKCFRRVSYRNRMVACTDRSHSLVAVGFNSRQCIVERAAGFETASLL